MVKKMIRDGLKERFEDVAITGKFSTVTDIEKDIDLSRPTVLKHLKQIEDLEVVKKGRMNLVIKRKR